MKKNIFSQVILMKTTLISCLIISLNFQLLEIHYKDPFLNINFIYLEKKQILTKFL